MDEISTGVAYGRSVGRWVRICDPWPSKMTRMDIDLMSMGLGPHGAEACPRAPFLIKINYETVKFVLAPSEMFSYKDDIANPSVPATAS